MDPVSHAALGAACSQAILYRHDKRNAWIAGGLAALAPDLDIFIRSAHDPLSFMIYHRQFTHSLIFIPLGGLLIALVLLLFKRFRFHWPFTVLAALIGYSTHGLLDACTSYGTLLLWPFSTMRISWDWIAIVDPFFTIPLILGLAWSLVWDNRRGVVFGLVTAGLFLIFNIVQHQRALMVAETYAKQNRGPMTKLRAFPYLASSTRWRTAGYIQQQLFIAEAYTPLFKSSQIYPQAYFPAFHKTDLPKSIQGQQLLDFNVFNWFTDGYLITAQSQPLILVDGRYLEGNKPLVALWGIRFLPNQLHVESIRSIPLRH